MKKAPSVPVGVLNLLALTGGLFMGQAILWPAVAVADPQLTSWFTGDSTLYARIYTSDANKLAGTTATTWTNGNQSQSLPAYAGVQKISYSTDWVYFTTSDLGPYVMGPWYNNAARTQAFVNLPKNQAANYRIPRTATLPAPPSAKTATGLGVIGYLVDGVSLFDPTDGFVYVNGAETSQGSGQWHRDAYVNESVTFDPGNNHQENTGTYHNHADPIALRYLLGDHVDYNATTKAYSESASAPTRHSPILGWMSDGYPLYGPYGYSSALDASSGIRRMVSGFVKRDGTTSGVDNIVSTGRTALPAWATRNNGNTAASGPAVSTTYPLGRYIEDSAYLGDITNPSTTQKYQQGVDFDLNEYNVRYCVTPEFPEGTYAYFLCIDADGTPVFPYNINRYYFGSPTGGAVAATETVTQYFSGGPDVAEAAKVPSADPDTGDVTLTWSCVEGGTYKVEATSDLTTWSTLSSTQTAASHSLETSYVDSGTTLTGAKRFYRISRTALAAYDTSTGTPSGGGGTGGSEGISTVSPDSGSHGASVTLTITLNSGYTTPPPPASVAPTGVTLTKSGAATISATGYTRDSSSGVVTAMITLPAGATTGAYTLNVTFGPNTWSKTDAFTVN